MNTNPVLVEVLRGGTVESWHRGAYAVVDAEGRLVASAGDIERPIFPRSAVKLLQALPMVESGAPERLGLDDRELALACASHQGEAAHEATAAAMLAKAGVDVSALECGVHWPYAESAQHALVRAGREPCALHNNCSGKHAGFVCLAHAMAGGRDLRGFLSGYVGRDHPVMREVSASLAAATGWDLDRSACGTDGCSIPTHAVPLRHLALAYARVGTGHGWPAGRAAAARRLRQAIARAPLMVAGSGKFDTLLMERLGERVCCKVGAEGVYCAALPERGLGVAVKMDDGNNARGCEVVLAALVQALLPLDLVERDFVEGLAQPRLFNRAGREIGALRPTAVVSVSG